MKQYFFLLLFLLYLLWPGCTAEPPPTLSFEDRELVDSLFKLKIDSLKPLFDQNCSTRFDSAVQFKSDSMLKVRQAEIQKYLERLRLQTPTQ